LDFQIEIVGILAFLGIEKCYFLKNWAIFSNILVTLTGTYIATVVTYGRKMFLKLVPGCLWLSRHTQVPFIYRPKLLGRAGVRP
jgi:hypothetical protein